MIYNPYSKVWNVWSGCTKVSDGCYLCNRAVSSLIAGKINPIHEGTVWMAEGKPFNMRVPRFTGRINIDEAQFEFWLNEKKYQRVEVCPHSDVFHEDILGVEVRRLYIAIKNSPNQDFFICTKRAKTMALWLPQLIRHYGELENLWLGISVENQQCFDERIESFGPMKWKRKFLDVRPLLERIDVTKSMGGINPIRWLIIGGETHHLPNMLARPFHIENALEIFNEANNRQIPVFFTGGGSNIMVDGQSCSGELLGAKYRQLIKTWNFPKELRG